MNVSCWHGNIIDAERPVQGLLDLRTAGFGGLVLEFWIPFPDFYGKDGEYGRDGKDGSYGKNSGGDKNGKNGEDGRDSKNGRAGTEEAGKDGAGTVGKRKIKPAAERYSLLFASCKKLGMRIPLAEAPSFELPDLAGNAACRKNYMREDGSLDTAGAAQEQEQKIAFGVRAVLECIELCGRNGVGSLLVRPVACSGASEREWEINRDFYGSLAQKARECGVRILLKNTCRNIGGHLVRGACAEPLQAARWVDRLNAEAGGDIFGFCMDSGICTICGNDMQEFARTLGSRVKAVILRDGDGQSDISMLPFSCARNGRSQTDWMSLIRGLRDIGFEGELVVNFADTAGAFSPLLRPTLYRLAKESGDFFKWQVGMERTLGKYRSIVLFGAGNMCRNYMKCFGEKYMPLFTCDNNPKLWGTEFEGLAVKNPEELKRLPKDCGVYICNIYYREIEAQLRKMGVDNIEYFNDEYMPSFYFDRLVREE